MKFNAAIIFIASLASGVYASGNLRSCQNGCIRLMGTVFWSSASSRRRDKFVTLGMRQVAQEWLTVGISATLLMSTLVSWGPGATILSRRRQREGGGTCKYASCEAEYNRSIVPVSTRKRFPTDHVQYHCRPLISKSHWSLWHQPPFEESECIEIVTRRFL